MNFADSEIVASILNKEGFGATRNFEEADLILLIPVPSVKKRNKLSENDLLNSKR